MNSGHIFRTSRCKVCHTPIRGISSWPNRLRGITIFSKNPQLCNRCSKVSFPPTEQEITVMFADVRGFTSMSEKMLPQQVRQLLNIFYATASEILIKNDALVDKFIGDAVMALFNAPIPQPHHRQVALQSSIILHEKLASLKLPFDIGIGLNSGTALTGNVGAGEVTDYTAIGDTVNVAARLSGIARKGEILAGISTCRDSFEFPSEYATEKVSLQVKGKELPVDAFRIYRLLPATPAT